MCDKDRERKGIEQCDKVATTETAENDIQSRFLDKNLIQTLGGYCGRGMSYVCVCVWRILRCETEPHTHTHTCKTRRATQSSRQKDKECAGHT